MKKTILLIIVLLVSPLFLFSQSFTFHSDTLNFSGQPGERFDHFVDIHNISGQNLNLNVIRTQNDLPNTTWTSSLCVGILCFTFTVDTIDAPYWFGPLLPDSILDFHLQVNTDSTTTGMGIVTVKVENQNNPADTASLTFTFSTEANAINDGDSPYLKTFYLGQNYPNPFNPSTHIPFEIGGAKAVDVQVSIYNLLGQKVNVLLDEQLFPGNYEVTWNALDQSGHKVPTGIYFYELQAGDFRQIHKLLLVQ
jgi:hypothetical protein